MSTFIRRVAAWAGCAVGGAALGAPMGVLFPITEVGLHEDEGRSTRLMSLGTSFGKSALRQADYVVSGGSWSSGRLNDRAPGAVSDLDLSTDPENGGALGSEVAVMFGRGFSSLHAGPDIFVVDSSRRVTRPVTVSPVYRVNGAMLVEGEPALVHPEAAFGFVSAAGRDVGGVGIDLDGWRVQGMAPEGALLVGVVFRSADDEPLGPMKLMLGESIDPGEHMDRRPGGGAAGAGLIYRGGARDQQGSGSGRGSTSPAPVPSPSGAAGALMALGLAGVRRRRQARRQVEAP